MTWTLRQIHDHIAAFCQKKGWRRGVPSSYTVDALSRIPSEQSTDYRLSLMRIDFSDSGIIDKSCLVVESELASVAIELAKRGAIVTGLCRYVDEVFISRAIAEYLAVPLVRSGLSLEEHKRLGAMQFFHASPERPWEWPSCPWFRETESSYDIVVALDMREEPMVFQALRTICNGTLYFESRARRSDPFTTVRVMREFGFCDITEEHGRYVARVSR